MYTLGGGRLKLRATRVNTPIWNKEVALLRWTLLLLLLVPLLSSYVAVPGL